MTRRGSNLWLSSSEYCSVLEFAFSSGDPGENDYLINSALRKGFKGSQRGEVLVDILLEINAQNFLMNM